MVFSKPILSLGPTGPALREETRAISSGFDSFTCQLFPGLFVVDQKLSLNGARAIAPYNIALSGKYDH